MNIRQALQERIRRLYQDRNLPVPDLSAFCEETTMETIEQLCTDFGISIADFFTDDLFYGIE